MKKSSIVSAFMLLIATLMLSGCIVPYWGDGHNYEGGGGNKHDNGRHGGRR